MIKFNLIVSPYEKEFNDCIDIRFDFELESFTHIDKIKDYIDNCEYEDGELKNFYIYSDLFKYREIRNEIISYIRETIPEEHLFEVNILLVMEYIDLEEPQNIRCITNLDFPVLFIEDVDNINVNYDERIYRKNKQPLSIARFKLFYDKKDNTKAFEYIKTHMSYGLNYAILMASSYYNASQAYDGLDNANVSAYIYFMNALWRVCQINSELDSIPTDGFLFNIDYHVACYINVYDISLEKYFLTKNSENEINNHLLLYAVHLDAVKKIVEYSKGNE